MHYGHPDVFDRVFHITRGGISKASRVINISEDIFAGILYIYISYYIYIFSLHLLIYLSLAGFNSTLRQGNITHHEYIQVLLLLFFHIIILPKQKHNFFFFFLKKNCEGWKGERCRAESDSSV